MKHACALCCLTLLCVCACGKQNSLNESLSPSAKDKSDARARWQDKVARVELLSSMIGCNIFREDSLPIAAMADADYERASTSLDPLIGELERTAHQSFLLEEERRIALERLADRSFNADPRAALADISAIIAIIQEYECIDPRIMSIDYIDKHTLGLSCGSVRGPLAGDGTYYVANRVNGVWRITRKATWIS